RIFRSEDSTDLRPESQLAIGDPVVNQFDPHGIPRHDQALVTHIPDGQPKHAVEMIEDISAPFFVAVDDHFRIGIRSKLMYIALQLYYQFSVFITLAV